MGKKLFAVWTIVDDGTNYIKEVGENGNFCSSSSSVLHNSL